MLMHLGSADNCFALGHREPRPSTAIRPAACHPATSSDRCELLRRRYGPRPYHNSSHAAAVVFSLHKVMTAGGVANSLACASASRDILLFSAILAAAVHDLGHLGVTTDFLVKVGACPHLSFAAALQNCHPSSSRV